MRKFEGKKIYLACGHTDMRKSINGLTSIVSNRLKLNVFEEAVFIFCNKNRDTIKILEWDKDGFLLYLKHLERERFMWPKVINEKTIMIDFKELEYLLLSPKLEQKFKSQVFSDKTTV